MEGIYAIVYLAYYDVVFSFMSAYCKNWNYNRIISGQWSNDFYKKIHLKHTYRDFLKTTEY